MARFDIREVSLRTARILCDANHSHHEPAHAGKWALGAFDNGVCVCVAVVARPVARMLDTGNVLEVVRLASDGSTRGAASALLRACVAEAANRGVHRVVSYTLLGELGACYRAARWRPVALTRGGNWGRASRSRNEAKQPGAKARWEGGRDALPRSMEAWDAIIAHAGRVVIPGRVRDDEAPDVF